MEQYKTRILSYTAGKDPVAMQREAPEILSGLVNGAPEEQLGRRPAPGKWSVLEIIVHMAEDEITSAWRYRQMIENDGVSLAGFDQDLWAQLGHYGEWKLKDALELFRVLREANLRMFEKLTPEQWQHHGIHAERGRMTVRDLATQMAGHDRNHIEQIERILGKANSLTSTGAA